MLPFPEVNLTIQKTRINVSAKVKVHINLENYYYQESSLLQKNYAKHPFTLLYFLCMFCTTVFYTNNLKYQTNVF